jgi:hypothetical protein
MRRMPRVLFRLGLILAIGLASPSHTQTQSVVAGPGDSQKLPYVLVANNGMRAHRVEERAIFAASAASAEAKAEIVKIKARAPRKARDKSPSSVSAETSRRLFELQLLDALRSAGRR